MSNTLRDERGQVTIFLVGMALVAFAVTGLAVDGTRAFLMRRTLQNAADSAALAGAGELDARAYYSSGGEQVVLAPSEAHTVARGWLTTRGIDARAEILAGERSVSVTMRVDLPMVFLGLVGIDRVGVAARATAEPEEGLVPTR